MAGTAAGDAAISTLGNRGGFRGDFRGGYRGGRCAECLHASCLCFAQHRITDSFQHPLIRLSRDICGTGMCCMCML